MKQYVQPIELLKAVYIPKLLSLSRRYMVIQTYYPGLHVVDTAKPTEIIVSAYADLELAKSHKNGIKDDRLQSILDLHEENHRKMILDIIEGTRYLVYWTTVSHQDADSQMD